MKAAPSLIFMVMLVYKGALNSSTFIDTLRGFRSINPILVVIKGVVLDSRTHFIGPGSF